MNDAQSYRRILKSSSIIGGASVLNILIGLLRYKVAALLLGPAGIGAIGLLTNIVATAGVIAGLGLATVGTRQIAEAAGEDDRARLAVARRALAWGTAILALIGGIGLWLLRAEVSGWVAGGAIGARDMAWLACATALTVGGGSQTALLNGLRRVGDLAIVSVASGALATVVGIACLWAFGAEGILGFVVATPAAAFVIGHLLVRRLPRVEAPAPALAALWPQWRAMARIGASFMLASLVGTVAQLFVRSYLQHHAGAETLGFFQASWLISMNYMTFVLAAMGADYYPRLTAVIRDHAQANAIVNQQTEVALLLGAPVLIAMVGLAPFLVHLLYAASFAPAAGVLRLQTIGDALKIVSWPLGFVILASGRGMLFLLSEAMAMAVFCAVTVVLLPRLGVAATGVAFIALYAAYLPWVHWQARRYTGFRWTGDNAGALAAIVAVLAVVAALGHWSAWAGALTGCMAAAAAAWRSAERLSRMSGLAGGAGSLAGIVRQRWRRGAA